MDDSKTEPALEKSEVVLSKEVLDEILTVANLIEGIRDDQSKFTYATTIAAAVAGAAPVVLGAIGLIPGLGLALAGVGLAAASAGFLRTEKLKAEVETLESRLKLITQATAESQAEADKAMVRLRELRDQIERGGDHPKTASP